MDFHFDHTVNTFLVVGTTVGQECEATINHSFGVSQNHIIPKTVQKSSIERPKNGLDNIDMAQITEKSRTPPKTLKEQVKDCFGFCDSDMSEDYEDMDDNNIPERHNSTELSSERSTSISSPPHEPLNGYLNSTQASITSPARRKQHIVPHDVSRIPSRSKQHIVPLDVSRIPSRSTSIKPNFQTSRFAYNNIRTKAPSVIASSANILPRSMYDLSPNCNLRRSITAKSNFRAQKQSQHCCDDLYNKPFDPDKNLCDNRPTICQQKNERIGAALAITDMISNKTNEALDPKNDEDNDAENKYNLGDTENTDENKVEGLKGSKDAFALLRNAKDSKLKDLNRKKEYRKSITMVSKPSKAQKQTLIYETDGDSKKLKAPKARKPENSR